MDNIPVIKCTYSGKIYVTCNGKFAKKTLPNYAMPFQISQRGIIFEK